MNMKKAIVLGATGGVGNPLTAELVKRGIETVAFGRSPGKLQQLARQQGEPRHLRLETGDAFNADDVARAAAEADVIFHSANVPYHEMESKLLPLGEAVMEAAERLGTNVVIVDGIYPYGKRTIIGRRRTTLNVPTLAKGKCVSPMSR